MPVYLDALAIEMALGGDFIQRLRDLGANCIYTPNALSGTSLPNLATGEATVVIGYGSSAVVTEVVNLEDYPATIVGDPTLGVRGPLPEGRTAATLDGSTQYLTASGVVASPPTQVLTWSPLTGRQSAATVVALIKGGNADEPIAVRSPGFALYTTCFTRTTVGTGITFPNVSDPNNYVLVVASHDGVWVNGVSVGSGTFSSGSYLGDANDGNLLYIGRNAAGTDFFTGTVACVAFLPTDLDGDDALALYNSLLWTDVSSDLRGDVTWSYGLPGPGIDDLLGDTGSVSFSLNNAANNSAGLMGYYSPNHANCREGFRLGAYTRLSLTYNGTTYYKMRARVRAIDPMAGLYRDRVTNVVAYDWINDLATSQMPVVGVQLDKRVDELIKTLITNMKTGPAAIDFATGADTFPYAFDSSQRQNQTAMNEAYRVLASERAMLYLKGDTEGGGTLRLENRHTRALSLAAAYTFDDDMVQLESGRSTDEVVNVVRAATYPRTVGGTPQVLYSLDANPPVAAGQKVSFTGLYRDPDQTAVRVGGLNMITPVATTDWTVNTAADGSGTDLTASCTLVFEDSGNKCVLSLTNDSGQNGYITKMDVRGTALRSYDTAIAESSDDESVQIYGPLVRTLDMPYQDDPAVGQGVADYSVSVYSDPLTGVRAMTIHGNKSAARMVQACAIEPGDRLAIDESVTGIAATVDGVLRGFFVQRVEGTVSGGRRLFEATFQLAPADRAQFWILENAQLSLLDETTRPGYA